MEPEHSPKDQKKNTSTKRKREDTEPDCVTCYQFFGTTDKDGKCSQCFDPSKRKAPPPPPKAELSEDKMSTYWFNFVQLTRLPYRTLDSDSKLKMLVNICQDLTPQQVYWTLHGLMPDKWPFPVVLWAHEADALFLALQAKRKNPDQPLNYQYVHAICGFILDIWNVKFESSVMDCYWRDMGELTSIPGTLEKLVGLWTILNKPMRGSGLAPGLPDPSNLDKKTCQSCILCEGPLLAHPPKQQLGKAFVRCKTCETTVHVSCVASSHPSCSGCNKSLITEMDNFQIWRG